MVELGHVALRVRDLERLIDFYRQAVGLKLVGRICGGRAALLTGGRQHHGFRRKPLADAHVRNVD